MIVRKLLAASFSAAVFMSAFAVTEASAKAGKCKAVEKPQCNLVLRADCTKETKCGCQKWVCRL